MKAAESSPDLPGGTATSIESFFAMAVRIFLVDLQEAIKPATIAKIIMDLIIMLLIA
jgi:hypothetical protein